MTIVYAERDPSHVIKGVYAQIQVGYAEEAIDDGSPEVVAFYASLKPSPAELARIDGLRTDSVSVRQHMRQDTAAELEAYVRAQINADAVTNLATAQQCLKRLETGQVILMKALASLLYGPERGGS